MNRRTLIVSAAATVTAPSVVRAQAWPTNPIRVIHGYDAALRDRLNEALRQAMARPDIEGRLEELGNDTRVSTPSEFRARVEQDMARWRPLAHVVNQS